MIGAYRSYVIHAKYFLEDIFDLMFYRSSCSAGWLPIRFFLAVIFLSYGKQFTYINLQLVSHLISKEEGRKMSTVIIYLSILRVREFINEVQLGDHVVREF